VAEMMSRLLDETDISLETRVGNQSSPERMHAIVSSKSPFRRMLVTPRFDVRLCHQQLEAVMRRTRSHEHYGENYVCQHHHRPRLRMPMWLIQTEKLPFVTINTLQVPVQ
jgi:hypothetical protein